MNEITVNITRANQALTRYVTELGQNAGEVIRREMRLLLQQCIRFTPPKTYAQGRAAIARDIKRAVKQAEPDWITDNIKNEKLRLRLRMALESKNEKTFEALMKVLSPAWQVVGFEPQIHQSLRDGRGRVPSGKSKRISMQTREWKRYIATIQKRAGMMKASWIPALQAVGGKAPGWIESKAQKFGTFKDATLINFGNPSFTATSNARGVGQFSRIYGAALKSRAVSMGRNVKRLLNEAKKKATL